MKPVYVCLPNSLYGEKGFSDFLQGDFKKGISRYFEFFSLVICHSQSDSIEFYAMGENRRDTSPEDAISFIRSSFSSLGIEKEKVKIRINYASLNPSFNPSLFQAKEEKGAQKSAPKEFDYESLSKAYVATDPFFTFEQTVLSPSTKEEIFDAIAFLGLEKKILNDWGLSKIIPNSHSVLNFYGPSGTGKTMAAEALASHLGKKILKSSYADIESKYVGEGPKMLKAIFLAAKRQDALLFIDEADSLLSKRLLSVSDGSAQALNSMRSQLLMCIDSFEGVAVFATNLISNYDEAFLSRMVNIEFPLPDEEARLAIWKKHICEGGVSLPLGDDVDLTALSKQFEFVGRDIKNAVQKAAVNALSSGRERVDQEDFMKACKRIKASHEALNKASGK